MFDSAIAAHIRELEQPAQKRPAEKQKMAGKYCGSVHRWSRFGYGFVRPDQRIAELGDRQEVFVGSVALRRSNILQPLQHGDRIAFDIRKARDDRYEATNITLLDQAKQPKRKRPPVSQPAASPRHPYSAASRSRPISGRPARADHSCR